MGTELKKNPPNKVSLQPQEKKCAMCKNKPHSEQCFHAWVYFGYGLYLCEGCFSRFIYLDFRMMMNLQFMNVKSLTLSNQMLFLIGNFLWKLA